MNKRQFVRTQSLLGQEGMERLMAARVAVFGIGGVGGFAVEALARSGIGALDLIDSDTVCESNLNRQIIALHSTLGRSKVEVMKERILDINPKAAVQVHNCFFLPENAKEFPFAEYDYVVDAVDTVTAKLELILRAKEAGTPIISCMGAGNKLDPTRFQVADIYQTKVCPLAKVMRRELKKRGVEQLKVVYSEEVPEGIKEEVQSLRSGEGSQMEALKISRENAPRRSIPGSTAFVPSVAGLILAGEVIQDIAWNR
ncbi:MAG: tRNA threonylcarbamoyladenosine dehydratase [Lachnospiraceae bacterium]|nr:tRNA threonylcarbamoyladenosine dehydratase [Lachnospiraceae bacterium]